MSWNHLERKSSKRLHNAFKLLTLKFWTRPEIVFKIEKKSLQVKTFRNCLQDRKTPIFKTFCLQDLSIEPPPPPPPPPPKKKKFSKFLSFSFGDVFSWSSNMPPSSWRPERIVSAIGPWRLVRVPAGIRYRELDCLFNSLFRSTRKERQLSALLVPLWEESDWWILITNV